MALDSHITVCEKFKSNNKQFHVTICNMTRHYIDRPSFFRKDLNLLYKGECKYNVNRHVNNANYKISFKTSTQLIKAVFDGKV